MDLAAEYLKNHPQAFIEIAGHTDSTGSGKLNQKLSEERARSVSEYLIANLIDKGRIHYQGYGSSKPIATNNTEEGRRRNRRLELTIR